MRKICVSGGRPLSGEISVSGSKNAALPIIFSCILIRGVSEIDNLPDIGDTRVALDILSSMGAVIRRQGARVYIDTEHLFYSDSVGGLAGRLRASTYLIGACLGRFGRVRISEFGGCNFSYRPIDMHLDACRLLGCRVEEDEIVGKVQGGEIYFDKPSVGATVNAILLGATASGKSRVLGVAREPHIDCLIDFLISAGADIRRIDSGFEIEGRELHGGRIRIIDDMIEAGSYLTLSLMSGGGISLLNCPFSDMGQVLDAFSRLGAVLDGGRATIGQPRYAEITARPYPDFPTDLQPIFAPLMAYLSGGKITDEVWRERFGYLEMLREFGVRSRVVGNCALIFPSDFRPASVVAPDLRGGFACLLAALCAEGESEIYSPEIILRGYERICEKLRTIGARIDIENI